MTSEPTTAGEPESRDGTGDWDGALSHAFELLGAGVADPGARYAVYYEDEPLSEYGFPNRWLTGQALTSAEAVPLLEHLADDYPLAMPLWQFDLRETLFRFNRDFLDGTGPWGEGGHLGPRPFDDAFAADVRAASIPGIDETAVRGAELAPVLGRHGVDLTREEAEQFNLWVTVLARVATDGTLADAMRAATLTWRGPEHLQRPGTEWYPTGDHVDRRWRDALDAVEHPGLRDHLRLLCFDAHSARADGAYYCGTEYWPARTGTLGDIGCILVAGWEFGEAQAGTVVVRLPGEPVATDAG